MKMVIGLQQVDTPTTILPLSQRQVRLRGLQEGRSGREGGSVQSRACRAGSIVVKFQIENKQDLYGQVIF